MNSAIFLTNQGEWSARVRAILSARMTVFDAEHLGSNGTLSQAPFDVALLEVHHLTDDIAQVLERVKARRPGCVTVCIAEASLAERAQVERALAPNFWIIVPAGDLQLRSQIDSILAYVQVRGSEGQSMQDIASAPILRPGVMQAMPDLQPQTENTLSRAVGRMTGSLDPERVFAAYCDAVQEMTGCVSYCLLWADEQCEHYTVARSEGLPPIVEKSLLFSASSPLPSVLQQHRGLVTADMLCGATPDSASLCELQLCGGVLAVPMFSHGVLRGIMVVGPKAIGKPYHVTEAETIFMLSASVVSLMRQSELHEKLESQNSYIDQVLSTMASGLVSLQADGTIRVCNPYAANVLELDVGSIIGSDVRALPAPLGDYLYACFRYGEERSREEVTVLSQKTDLRISTRQLREPNGTVMGSMMLLEDMSAEKALAQEKRKAERNAVINQIVARFAHELKNPLATIQTFTELLPTKFSDPEFHHFCTEHVRRDVHRLDDLVVKLVSLSEPPHLSRELVRLEDLLQLALDRVALLDDTAPEKITLVPNGELPLVRVDSNATAAAIAHLLRYGIGQARSDVSVSTQLRNGDPNGSPILIDIRATDKNGSERDPSLVFEPSYVIDHPDVDLGPSASQRLIESQGGTLSVNRDGEDIVFRIALRPASHNGDEEVKEMGN